MMPTITDAEHADAISREKRILIPAEEYDYLENISAGDTACLTLMPDIGMNKKQVCMATLLLNTSTEQRQARYGRSTSGDSAGEPIILMLTEWFNEWKQKACMVAL